MSMNKTSGPLRVTLTGATGLIGRALVPALQRRGHTVVALVRSPERARARLGGDVELVEDEGAARMREALTDADAVVNLAGESILGRWTTARRIAMRTSRVDLTDRLVATMRAMPHRPRVFISGSATGYYGNQGDRLLFEDRAPGTDFLAQLSRDWEAAANAASDMCRVVNLRTGVVLARDGGALQAMKPAFSLGLGGVIGNGRQYMPWIHLHDLVEIIVRAVEDPRYEGPINAVSPNPATAEEFAHALGKALRRPVWMPIPAFALRAVLGEAADVLLFSQGAQPRTLQQLNHTWRFPTLTAAFRDLLGSSQSISIRRTEADRMPSARESEAASARYVLYSRTVLNTSLATAFQFFSKPENLGLITPAAMAFAITGTPTAMGEGAIIDYRIRVAGVPIRWRTRIVRWKPGSGFADVQEAGPYRTWYHEHAFRADGAQTVMEDRVFYTPPLGVLGRIAHAWIIRDMLVGIFQYRQDVIRLRFGSGG